MVNVLEDQSFTLSQGQATPVCTIVTAATVHLDPLY